MTRRSALVVVLLAFSGVLALTFAFGLWPAPVQTPGTIVHRASAEPSIATTVSPGKAAEVTLYFPNRRYIESGDESIEQTLGERYKLELDATDPNAVAKAALDALKAGPKSTAAAPAIPDRVIIRHVEVRDGFARVDFLRAGLSGGSLEEKLLVKSIVQTLTQLPQVRAVQFLIEGKAPETLMGHVSTAEPISVAD
jgi:spore germination protein GerM